MSSRVPIQLAILVLCAVVLATGCATCIDNLPGGVPKGYIECSWQSNPGFPLVFSLHEGTGTHLGDLRSDEVPTAAYHSKSGRGKFRFAARPGVHTLVVSSTGEAETLSPFARGSGAFGPMPANEREILRVEVSEGMTTPVRIVFERQDSWADWEGREVKGTYLMRLTTEH
ncbi:MAG: hypothetical protein KAW17_11605 [Candidatus Eisenbacteria sp.]|nr:hypothetical protein [Candidatus Eisenbacteria bacterium]